MTSKEFDREEFLDLYGDMHSFIGMILHIAHGDDKEMMNKAAKAAATLMAKLVTMILPDITNEEVYDTFAKGEKRVQKWSNEAEEVLKSNEIGSA